jgi:ATP-binding cassette, subfamily B, bacterial IrtA/YbtP
MSAGGRKEQGPDYLASLKLLSGHLKAANGKFAGVLLAATVSAFLELVPVWSIYRLVSAVIADEADLSLFLTHAGLSAAAILAGYGLFAFSTILAHIVAFEAIYSLRRDLARHLARLPLGYFSGRSSADAKKLIVDEPERLESVFAHGLPDGVSALSTWIAVSLWLFATDWRMALAAVFVTPLSFLLLGRAMASAGRLAAEYQRIGGRMNVEIADYVAGMPVTKIFNRTGRSLGVAVGAVNEYGRIQAEMTKHYLPLGGPFFTLVLTNIVFILPVGLLLLRAGETDLQTLLFFVIVGANYSQPLLKLFNQFHHLAHLSIGSRLVADLLAVPAQHDAGRHLALDGRDITFEEVSFAYGDRTVLRDISFTARAGEMTALVGLSGSGKSTLASLVPRLHDVTCGRITMGGVDIRDMAIGQLMDMVALVFQDTFLFSDTIDANLRFGRPDATQAEIERAAKAARAHDFILALPEGYATRLGAGGVTLSGGERQRLAIARAILKDAPIVVLDEATAFTDPDNETAIQEAIRSLAAGKTLIVVAHRLHTIMHAPQIVVLSSGRVAERGRHDELLRQQGLYHKLWQSYTETKAIPLRAGSAVSKRISV